jgi:hypothetical protein
VLLCLGEPRSEAIPESNRRLRSVCDAICSLQRRDIETRRVVHETSILGAKNNMVRELYVRASTVKKGGAGLRIDSRPILRIEYQAGGPRQQKGTLASSLESEDVSGRDLMRVGRHTNRTCCQTGVLRV